MSKPNIAFVGDSIMHPIGIHETYRSDTCERVYENVSDHDITLDKEDGTVIAVLKPGQSLVVYETNQTEEH